MNMVAVVGNGHVGLPPVVEFGKERPTMVSICPKRKSRVAPIETPTVVRWTTSIFVPPTIWFLQQIHLACRRLAILSLTAVLKVSEKVKLAMKSGGSMCCCSDETCKW